eukprot:TRINITY_DN9805_c0_g1_i1.p1 TRINITY_DN9805_c0_g1~~TRINITY_DN9805_c0_g1_i1.p1  ORF type:complete len:319 (-),score=38.65 TRINITY_DN9805_c0_g1_i1:168-1124(-)
MDDRKRLGVCCLDVKARSHPMRELLQRIERANFEIIIFGDACILHEPVEAWPVCDYLIAFHSAGFPLEKALAYEQLRHPISLNDLHMQDVLRNRLDLYHTMDNAGIPHGNYLAVIRGPDRRDDFTQDGDTIQFQGKMLRKPFVEKPFDADNHDVFVYFPESMGGGCRRMFRKVDDRCSEFLSDVTQVRTDGSYLYEEFYEVQDGRDIKVYSVGPDYHHAEARRSPVVDGHVERLPSGREVRLVIPLSESELEIARRVSRAFKQGICGFDLLRASSGSSFVCDVNGWSFVKGHQGFYDHCAQQLISMMQQDHVWYSEIH